MFRQSVLSFFKSDVNGNYSQIPDYEIIFEASFHNLGISYTFEFERGYFSPFSLCGLNIFNHSKDIVNILQFDPSTYNNRPRVEIRAGYSPIKIKRLDGINVLKNSLPLAYSGLVYYFSEGLQTGGRSIEIKLSDVISDSRAKRTNKYFKAGTPVLSVLEGVLSELGEKYDTTAVSQRLSSLMVDQDIYYNLRPIYSDVLPQLSSQYSFYYYHAQDDSLIFKESGIPAAGVMTDVTSLNGLIEFPQSINWTQWNVRTLFGSPSLFSPGDWMRVYSNAFDTPFANLLIVNGLYKWQEKDAEIVYRCSANGQPVETYPILQF